MILFSNPSVQEVFNSYPENVRAPMLALRDLIFTTAQSMGVEKVLEETLKWGEPSYVCPEGSTLRIN